MGSILILVHQHGTWEQGKYFLHAISDIWRESGWRVIVMHGPVVKVNADIAILHVDLTVAPPDYLAFVRSFPISLNGAVADISKTAISSNLVRPGDGYDGPIIVKTNRNFAGVKEAELIQRGLLPADKAVVLREYPIFSSPAKAPVDVWNTPGVIVERFLAERRDGFYCLRTWMFLGDKETNSISYSNHPVVKAANVVRREAVAEVPEELRQRRRELGFDFGKFDYAIVDGRAVLYDANRTPSLGNFPREQYLPRVRLLAEGLKAFL